MYQPTTKSSYKYVSLDLAHLNQKKKSARHSLQQHRDYGSAYGVDFNIQNSWVQSGRTVDTLKDSMMAYSKRMSDIRRVRGIHPTKQSGPTVGVPALWINTGKGSLQLNMLEDNTRKYYAAHNRIAKSLGTIKLEPLLGNRRESVNSDIENVPLLQTHTMRQEAPLASIEGQVNQPVKVRHITVTITIPPPEEDEDESPTSEKNKESSPTNSISPPRASPYRKTLLSSPTGSLSPLETSPPSEGDEEEPLRKKLIPLGSGRDRPRKAKRMKLTEPSLEPIDEDTDDTNSIYTHNIEEGYNNLLNDLYSSQELMLEQKRRTVALLRQTNYAQRSHQQNRQLAMASLVKRKFKRLPSIPTGRPQAPIRSGLPSLRYTNNSTESARRRSPYDESINDYE